MAKRTVNSKLSEEDKKLSDYIRTVFQESYYHVLPSLERMEKMQQAYECVLPSNWSTYSQIYLPYIRTAVEQALPNVMNYLFPTSGLVSLIPTSPMPYEQVQQVRDYIEDLVTKKIGLKQQGLLTLKDAMKFNVGYGIVQTEIITPMVSVANTIFGGEEPVNVRRMDLGSPKETVSYKYINWRHIIPTPDGDTPETATGTFHLDPMREDAFRAMFAMDKISDNPQLKGSAETIIQNIRDEKCSYGSFPIWWIMHQFTESNNTISNNRAMNEINRMTLGASSPVVVPIMKCYFKNEHIWMVPDGTIIRHDKDKIQTLKNPIIKATPVPDGGNWFPLGDVESGRDAADGANVFKNALLDLLTNTLHPTTIVNRLAVTDSDVGMKPHSIIESFGKVGDAVSYVNPPQLPNGIQGIGQDFEYQFAQANGQPQNLQGQGTAGVMRGGGGAFESLLQTTMARSKLAGAVLEMDWLQRIIENVLIMVQVLGLEDSYVTSDDLSKSFIEKTITANELRNTFAVSVNLDDKFRQTPSDKAMDMALYREVVKDDPSFDWSASREWIIGDQELARKLRATPEVRDAQMKQLQERAAAAEQAKQGGLNPGQQAMQGGASQAGGV